MSAASENLITLLYGQPAEQRRLLELLSLLSHIDGFCSPSEDDLLQRLASAWAWRPAELQVLKYRLAGVARQRQGIRELVARLVAGLPDGGRGAVIELCEELILADGRVAQYEATILDMIVAEWPAPDAAASGPFKSF